MNKQDFISLVPDLRCAAVGAALAILDDCEEAEDVAQETMLRMWENVERLDDDARRAKAFAAVTARNLARNRLRQKRRWSVLRLLSRHDHETTDTPLHRIEVSDADSAFSQALQQLPTVWQRVLLMRNVEDMTFAEIAAVLGTSESSVRGLLTKARRRMVELINQQIR
jgi:RNA polymerase sigma-70 factor (ECF subfamily)